MNIHKKFFSKIGFSYLILGVIGIIFQIIFINILNMINPQYLSDMNLITSLSSIANYVLPFPIIYWLMKKIDTSTIEKNGVNAKTFILYIGITLTLMWMGNIIGLLITALLSSGMQSDIANPVQQLISSTNIWLNLIIISVIAPIFEEIFFRKLVIDRTIKYGAKVSIILSAVIFALFHGNLNQFFYALLMGGFLAYVYIKTGKITYTIMLHMIVNFMGSVVSIIISNSVTTLQSSLNMFDLGIILLYVMVIFVSLLIGIYGILNFKKARFNGRKTEIALKNPIKTMFLNYGMVCFIAFFVFVMVRQVLG